MKELVNILRHRRPAKSSGEQIFIKTFLDVIEGMQVDGFGNRYIEIGNGTTMFSCHTDTVHTDDAMQDVYIDPVKNHIFTSGILGADDGTGIWLMLNMIRAGVTGLYVFHREEEIGGNGSTYFAENSKDLLEGKLRCIAFDRKGYGSVITEQFGVCCSEEFALELAIKMNKIGKNFDFMPDDTGLFTDSANYTHLIPECTNLSVGYFHQHMPNEYQDTVFAEELLKVCLTIDWEALGVYKEVEEEYSYYNGYGYDVKYPISTKPKKATNIFNTQYFQDTFGATKRTEEMSFDMDLDNLFKYIKADDFDGALDMISNDPELGTSMLFELYAELGED
tara:strand:- start:8654 stop:9658 length:1005 start_codon:yes stop_codon:yes gene_type:complete